MLRAITILLLMPAFAFGTLPATTVWEIRTDGSPTNGGGYKSNAGTTDYSQQASPVLAVTDLACTTGGAVCTNTVGDFTAQMVGSICYIAGTHFTTGWYEIITYTNAHQITLDRDPTDGSNASSGTCNVGGALKCPGDLGVVFQTAAQSVAGMKAYIRNTGTDYTLDTATANTAATTGYGGPLDLDETQMDSKAFYFKGYDPAQGRDSFAGERPTIHANGFDPTNLFELKPTYGQVQTLAFVAFDGDDTTGNGIEGTPYSVVFMVNVSNVDGYSCFSFLTHVALCSARSSAANGFNSCYFVSHCLSDACEYGFTYSDSVACIASKCTRDSYNNCRAFSCVSYDSSEDGFESDVDVTGGIYVNCVSVSDGLYSFKSALRETVLINCAADTLPASGRTSTPIIDINPVVLTADPFTNAAAGDFSLNNTAGGGALLRAAGISPYGQTGYLDIGAVQHPDTAGGGGETSHVWVR